MSKIANENVAKVFSNFPDSTREALLALRQLILQVAAESDDITEIEETLKWGEPAYLCKSGSTIRLGFRKSDPDRYAMYFNCQSKLIETFREVYSDEFEFDGNRALIFNLHETLPIDALSHCIDVALRYHRCKNLPLLGM